MYANVICPHCREKLALDVEADAEVLKGDVRRIVNVTIRESIEEEKLVLNIADILNKNSITSDIKTEIITRCRVSPDYAERLEKLVSPLLKPSQSIKL